MTTIKACDGKNCTYVGPLDQFRRVELKVSREQDTDVYETDAKVDLCLPCITSLVDEHGFVVEPREEEEELVAAS